MPEHKIPRAVNADAPMRLTKQFVPPPTTELLEEILKVARRRLFVAFQRKEPCDFVVADKSTWVPITGSSDKVRHDAIESFVQAILSKQ